MKPDSKIFDIFYDELRRAFIQKEFNGKLPDGISENSPDMWYLKKKAGNGSLYAAQNLLNGSKVKDQKIFYNKRTAFRTDPNAEIDDTVLYNGLKYIDVEKPQGIFDFDTKSIEEQVAILWHQFEIKTHFLQIPSKTNLTSTFSSVTKLAKDYFSSLSRGQFDNAWNALSIDFRNDSPWYNDFNKFRFSHLNSTILSDILVFDIRALADGYIVNCRVFYEEKKSIYTNRDLRLLDAIKVSEVNDLVKSITSLTQHFESKGVTGFENIEIAKLFDPLAIENILVSCNFDYSKLDSLFGTSKTDVPISRLYHCSCIYEQGGWYIRTIEEL